MVYFEGTKKQACNYAEDSLCCRCEKQESQKKFLQNIHFNELFQMYVKQKSVEYSTCGIL